MYVPHAEGVLDMYGNNSYVELPVSEVAAGVRNTTYAEVYKELWPEGIVCALNDFARAITENSQKNIMAQQMLTISEIWKDLSFDLGKNSIEYMHLVVIQCCSFFGKTVIIFLIY